MITCIRAELGRADEQFLRAAPQEYSWRPPQTGAIEYNTDVSATRRAEARCRELEEKVSRLTSQVIVLKLQLNILQRWQPGDREYEETVKYIAQQKYQQALGRLQRLVIQRLFELHKLNVPQTGNYIPC